MALVYDSRAVSLLADPWNTSVDIYQHIRDNIARTRAVPGCIPPRTWPPVWWTTRRCT